ncbi:hypothetical protein UCRPC4_g02891 [Phaeomoniella chlamydospora]|uniref:Uncharacterized protein n=1 Tax=Phaeomoniella chlamydospora TaxID=158046 RepID=A0A0G2GIR7_PHACM|nr:hypothetical protein UCRPC4_g02891 [Phaeomoniella chlamydospora]
MPLLRQMNEVYDECFDALDITGERRLAGDRRVAHCIYKHTDAKLSVEYGLHQVDLHGDPSGLYESGRPQPLSIHHWKSWSEIDVEKLLVVSRVCGDACLLHRWRFSNGWYLNNGFSLVKYSQDLPWGDRTIEKTWEDWETASDYSYVHSLAPLRPRDEGKITYRLKDAIVVGNKAVRQIYVHHPPDGGDDRVIDILWRAG